MEGRIYKRFDGQGTQSPNVALQNGYDGAVCIRGCQNRRDICHENDYRAENDNADGFFQSRDDCFFAPDGPPEIR